MQVMHFPETYVRLWKGSYRIFDICKRKLRILGKKLDLLEQATSNIWKFGDLRFKIIKKTKKM